MLKFNSKNFLITALTSFVVCAITISVYHYFFMLPFHQKVDFKNKALAVAEQEILFSPTLANVFRSSSPTDFINAAKISREAVVSIKTKSNLGNADRLSNTSGSGVILSAEGYIVTNSHVIGNSEEVDILLNDRREFSGKVIGRDENTDLALVKIESNNLPFLVLGNSDSLFIGEWVLAVGNPFKLNSTVTAGIVSAKARNINLLESQGIESFIQTDAAVNPGNSGGALVDTKGNLVGINTAILSNSGNYEGFSFAIPSNVVRKVVSDLKEFGAVQRGWMGIEIENIDAEKAETLGLSAINGVYIASVIKDGAAYQSGLKNKDVILSVNRDKTNSVSEFMEKISQFRPGDVLDIEYFRDKTLFRAKTILRNHLNTTDYVAIYKNQLLSELGLELRNMDSVEKSLFGIRGIVVVSVKSGSIVHDTKLESGYIITKINGVKTEEITDLMKILKSKRGEKILFEGFYKNYPGEYPYTFMMPQ